MPRLSLQEREQAIGRLNAGQLPRIIANDFNCSARTIQLLRERYNSTGSTDDRPRSGRPHVTTPRQDRAIVRQHKQNRFATASTTARNTIGIHRRPISRQTVGRRLRRIGLKCRRPYKGPILTVRHRLQRFEWARQHRHWRYQHWRKILFSDESRYCLSTADGRARVYRFQGERYDDNCVMERDPFGGPSIMVWGAIGLGKKIGPVVFQNIGPGQGNGVTAVRYIDQCLRPYILPYFLRHQNHKFQQDNARPHTARATQQYLQQNNIPVISWPPYSADLNPIEHLWDEIQRKLNEEQPYPSTSAELGAAFSRVWANIPRSFINRLIHSMYRRCCAVIRAKGGHTSY